MALPKNRQHVKEILDILKPLVLGKTLGAMSCNCGAVHTGPATATAIEPGGDTYPGQETLSYLWRVKMSYHPEDLNDHNYYSIGLDAFVDRELVKDLFSQRFGANPETTNPYQLSPARDKRVRLGLPAAVCIKDSSSQTLFYFDWGKEQYVARLISEMCWRQPKRIKRNTELFQNIVAELQKLTPQVYQGGPDPEFSFESNWLLTYQPSLLYSAEYADHLLVGISSTHQSSGTTYPEGQFNFINYHLD